MYWLLFSQFNTEIKTLKPDDVLDDFLKGLFRNITVFLKIIFCFCLFYSLLIYEKKEMVEQTNLGYNFHNKFFEVSEIKLN